MWNCTHFWHHTDEQLLRLDTLTPNNNHLQSVPVEFINHSGQPTSIFEKYLVQSNQQDDQEKRYVPVTWPERTLKPYEHKILPNLVISNWLW